VLTELSKASEVRQYTTETLVHMSKISPECTVAHLFMLYEFVDDDKAESEQAIQVRFLFLLLLPLLLRTLLSFFYFFSSNICSAMLKPYLEMNNIHAVFYCGSIS
jgi:hypothetical protein